jgi:hypothetical protein
MSKLTEMAERLERNGANISAPSMLRKLDEQYTLRRYGVKREKRKVVDENGNEVKSTFFPHLAITATCYARTWKLLEKAQTVFGYPKSRKTSNVGEVWEDKLLLACEHIVRWLEHEIDDEEMQRQISRLVNPLPKADYLRNINKERKQS